MLKWTLSLLVLVDFFTSLNALEISINSAKLNHTNYSTMHLKDTENFICEEEVDDFLNVTQVICAYPQKPSQKIKELQNNFFQIKSRIKNDTFFLIIEPFKKIKLLPVVFNLSAENSVYQASVHRAKHWMIIGYKDQLPLINNKEKQELGINFPFFLDKDQLPFVGSLDIKGNPVHIKRVEDVQDYLKIKKAFKEKKYELVIELINDVLINYPNTLFKAELLYYKIRVYSKVKDFDNVISISKEYLREYSSDENIPEVISLTAKSYSSVGMNIDADYFFDRLFSEHEKSIYAQWGYIYKGEMLENSGATTAAIHFYKKALGVTSSIDVGATAAYKLAHITIAASHKTAAQYIMKIIKAKPKFFRTNFKISEDMMHTFADNNDYVTASAIAKALSDTMTKDDDAYESLLKSSAIWLSKTIHKQEALSAINKYIKEYPDGDYIEGVEVAKDELFFDTDESNTSQKLKEYTKLMQEYQNDSIGNRAIYEKAKLLLKLHNFNEVLALKEDLMHLDDTKYKDVNQIIKDAVIGMMQNSLKDKKCHDVLDASNEYNITLSDKWDDGLYECAMKGGDFSLAKKMANKHFKSKDLEARKKWLFRYIKVDFETGNYSDVMNASKDLIALIDGTKDEKYKEVYRYIFDTYQRLEQKNNAIQAIVDIENNFGISYKDLDRYTAVMNIGNELNDDTIVITYGMKAYKIQKNSQAYPQSPLLEFAIFQAYINKENYNKALLIIQSLDNIKLNKRQKARQKYLLGSVYTKLWRDEDATNAYKASISADSLSPWAKLSTSALE